MTLVLEWLTKHGRLLAIAGAGLLCVSLLLWFGHSRYVEGEAAGRAQVQKLWDADRVAAEAAYAAAVKATNAKVEADRKVAREVEDGLREKIAAGDVAGRSLSQRLRDYQASLSRCRTLPAAPGNAGQPAGTSGVPDRDEEVERLSDSAWAACAKDAVRLDAIEQWRAGIDANR
jgi:hypothetical protein